MIMSSSYFNFELIIAFAAVAVAAAGISISTASDGVP
jgi:hypothetical protein